MKTIEPQKIDRQGRQRERKKENDY